MTKAGVKICVLMLNELQRFYTTSIRITWSFPGSEYSLLSSSMTIDCLHQENISRLLGSSHSVKEVLHVQTC